MIFNCRTKTRRASGFGKPFKWHTNLPKSCFGNESRSEKKRGDPKYKFGEKGGSFYGPIFTSRGGFFFPITFVLVWNNNKKSFIHFESV